MGKTIKGFEKQFACLLYGLCFVWACTRIGSGTKKKGLMSRIMAVHVRFESRYISLSSSAKQQREMTKFYVFWRERTAMANFRYLLLKLNAVGACLA